MINNLVLESFVKAVDRLEQIKVNQRDPINRAGNEFISSFMSLDSKHQDAWFTYGYKETLRFNDFYTMYRRFGVAHGGIEIPVDKCWQKMPKVVEDLEEHKETKWEKEIAAFFQKFSFWQRLRATDARQRVGRYGGLLIIVKDNRKLSDPLPMGLEPSSLVKLVPLYESQMYISTYESDFNSVDYGKPIMYQYEGFIDGTNDRTRERSTLVHHSRIIPWAEGADTDNITTGIPALEPCFNSMMTLEKIIGAGGEGLWKNARASIHMGFDQTLDINKLAAILGVDSPEEIKGAMDELVRTWLRGFDQNLMTQGGTVQPIQVALEDPVPFFNIALWDCASALKIPSTIWIGQQTGRLASDEDQSGFAQSMDSRNENFTIPACRATLDHLLQYNLLPKPPGDYFVKFESLLEPTMKEKLEGAKTMSEINKNTTGTGQIAPFTSEQMIGVTGMKMESTDLPDEEDEEDFEEE